IASQNPLDTPVRPAVKKHGEDGEARREPHLARSRRSRVGLSDRRFDVKIIAVEHLLGTDTGARITCAAQLELPVLDFNLEAATTLERILLPLRFVQLGALEIGLPYVCSARLSARPAIRH